MNISQVKKGKRYLVRARAYDGPNVLVVTVTGTSKKNKWFKAVVSDVLLDLQGSCNLYSEVVFSEDDIESIEPYGVIQWFKAFIMKRKKYLNKKEISKGDTIIVFEDLYVGKVLKSRFVFVAKVMSNKANVGFTDIKIINVIHYWANGKNKTIEAQRRVKADYVLRLSPNIRAKKAIAFEKGPLKLAFW